MPGQVLIYQLIGRFCPVENPVAIFSLEKSSVGRFHGTQSTSGAMFVIAVATTQRCATQDRAPPRPEFEQNAVSDCTENARHSDHSDLALSLTRTAIFSRPI
jgi:hypothetical protein